MSSGEVFKLNSKSSSESSIESSGDDLGVAIFCFSHSWGGLEQVAVQDACELAQVVPSLYFLCFAGSPVHSELEKRKNVIAHPIQIWPLKRMPRNHFDCSLRLELRRLFRKGVRIIHLHQTTYLSSVVPWLWFKKQVSLIVSRHIMNNHSKKGLWHRLLFQRVNGFWVVSETIKQNILTTHAIDPKKVQVVRLGLDFEKYDPALWDPKKQRALWGARSDTLVIGVVGRLDPAKGQQLFLEAVAALFHSARAQSFLWKFVLIGEETRGSAKPFLPCLKQLAKDLGIEHCVVFSGFHENIPEIMMSLDIVVMPSREEAFGLVAIEAMAMARPVLLSSGGSAQEIVGNETRGLLFQAKQKQSLSEKLLFLAEHPALRSDLGSRARAYALEFYNKRQRIDHTLSLYRAMLSEYS